MNVMDLAQAERRDLAAFLATLTPAQWQAPTLCAGWSVTDVVAHMFSYDELTTIGLITRFAKGRFVRANDIGVEEYRPLGPDRLLELVNRHLRPRGLTAGFGGLIALVDGTIHHQDIRRPLSMPRDIPPDRLTRVLDSIPTNPRLGARGRIRGLRLRATDLDWSTGHGPEVTGTGEALLMAMSGRRGVTPELTGPGQPILAARIDQITAGTA